jgi:uncharacterized protein
VTSRRLRIWIDLSNTPHVLFFEPIIRELERRGHSVSLTSRRFANTLALIRARGLRACHIGAGHDASRNETLKQARHVARTARLVAYARDENFDVAVSHLSYTQADAARRLGIATFGTVDYEHRYLGSFAHARCFMAPAVIPAAAFERCGVPVRVIRPYDGLKEHVYLSGFRPDPTLRARLGVGPRERLVTFRPIADHALYNDDSGNGVQQRLLRRLAGELRARVVVLPRTASQRRALEPLARAMPGIHLQRDAIDGPSLICASDMVVCGGGTMLREAAVLGVPAVSVFTGELGAVDAWLAEQGRVTLVRDDGDVERLHIERCRPPASSGPASRVVLEQIVKGICDTAAAR